MVKIAKAISKLGFHNCPSIKRSGCSASYSNLQQHWIYPPLHAAIPLQMTQEANAWDQDGLEEDVLVH